jgi:hypothetical protein
MARNNTTNDLQPIKGPRSRVPPVVSVALVAAFVAVLIGFGIGYRLGQASQPSPTLSAGPSAAGSRPSPTAPPSAVPDLRTDGVSDRLQRAAYRVAPAGWEVCVLAATISCKPLTPMTVDFPAQEGEYRLSAQTVAGLTSTPIAGGHLVVVAFLGQGDVAASLLIFQPDGAFGASRPVLTVDPGNDVVDYFDLDDVAPGRYALAVDFLPLPLAGPSPAPERHALAGFSVPSP